MSLRQSRRRARRYYDDSFYRDAARDASIIVPADGFNHFMEVGWKIGLNPSAEFDVSQYLANNQDVAEAGLNPLVHFVARGRFEGRVATSSSNFSVGTKFRGLEAINRSDQSGFTSSTEPTTEIRRRQLLMYLRPMFPTLGAHKLNGKLDVDYYSSQIRETNEISGSLTDHYSEIGFRIGLNPAPWFDTEWYLAAYPDVAEADVDPFKHFVERGFLEHRLPSQVGWRQAKTAVRFESQLSDLVETTSIQLASSRGRQDISDVKKTIGKLTLPGRKTHLAIGHDDYRNNWGGIQQVERIEETEAQRLNLNYLQIHPTVPTLSPKQFEHRYINLIVNGKLVIERIEYEELSDILGFFALRNSPIVSVLTHSVFGHDLEKLGEAVSSLQSAEFHWTIHDYSQFCWNPKLNLDSLVPCENPSQKSNSCLTCRFGHLRDKHVSAVENFMAQFNWKFHAPSQDCYARVARWLGKRSKDLLLSPHGALVDGEREVLSKPLSHKSRIAFVGQTTLDKGWYEFLELVRLRSSEFDFFHFGPDESDVPNLAWNPYKSLAINISELPNLLRDFQIDAVVVWPTWHETFCFVAYESVAAGSVVITHSQSGNVAYADSDATLIYRSLRDCLQDGLLDSEIRSLRSHALANRKFEFSPRLEKIGVPDVSSVSHG